MRITTPIALPNGYDEWCLGKNGFAHKLYPDGSVACCERVCEPYYDPRYQEAMIWELENMPPIGQ